MARTDANDHFEHLNRSIHCRAHSSVAVTVKLGAFELKGRGGTSHSPVHGAVHSGR
jgi:hypothetical protein